MSEEFLLILINFLVVPLLVELYRLIVNQFNFTPSKFHITIVLSAVAVALSFVAGEDFFSGLPDFSESILLWIAAVVQGVGELIGAAVLLYNLLYDKFFDAIGARFKLFAYRLK